jgi:hypothetical protein
MIRHIILTHSRETEYRRAVFAILSFWAWYTGNHEKVITTVFTDKPEFFTPYLTGLPIEYVSLSATQLEEMRGPRSFIHRIKMSIITHICEKYPTANVLFCDSDTFFIVEPNTLLHHIQKGDTVMHLCEYKLNASVEPWATSNPVHPQKFLDFIDKQIFSINLKDQQFQKNQFMWNSGVVGLSSKNTHLMSDIATLSDAFYENSEWILSEQIAFSLVLQTHTQIFASDKQVFHYWQPPLKPLMDKLLTKLISKSFSEQMLSERLIQVRRLTTEWPRAIKVANTRENALRAFSNGDWKIAVKCTLKALVASPLDTKFMKDIALLLYHN